MDKSSPGLVFEAAGGIRGNRHTNDVVVLLMTRVQDNTKRQLCPAVISVGWSCQSFMLVGHVIRSCQSVMSYGQSC